MSKKEKYIIASVVVVFLITNLILRYVYGFTFIDGYVASLVAWLSAQGTGIAFIGAFVEGLLFVGLYFPGSLVVVTTIASASPDISLGFVRVVLAICGLFLANLINYYIGYRFGNKINGWFNVKQQIETISNKIHTGKIYVLFLAMVTPGVAAITSVVFGFVKYPFKMFCWRLLAVLSFWYFCWGVIAFYFGSFALQFLLKYFSLVITLYLIYFIYNLFYKKNSD